MLSVHRSRNADKIYYNINILYSLEKRINNDCLGRVQYESEQTILDRASDYYISVVSFNIPLSSVPIFFAEPQPYPNTDVNKLVYQLGFKFGSVYVKQALQFSPQDLQYVAPPAGTVSAPNIPRTLYYGIWSYSYFLQLVNTAMQAAYATVSASPGFPSTFCPRIVFNQDGSNTFSIIADFNEFAANIEIYFDNRLTQFFQGFTYLYNDTLATNGFGVDASGLTRSWNKIMFIENNNVEAITSPISTNQITQRMDYPVMACIPSMRSILLKSDSMPINPEWLPAAGTASSGVPSYSRVLAEFKPLYSDTVGGSVPRSAISYTSEGAHRLINMLDSQPLRAVSLAIYWVDEINNEYPIKLSPRESISLKLCFHEKATYKG